MTRKKRRGVYCPVIGMGGKSKRRGRLVLVGKRERAWKREEVLTQKRDK